MKTKSPQELFDREVDNYCHLHAIRRPRCKEWVEFSQRFVDRYEQWNGCWVAEEAVKEWYFYMQMPEGLYEPKEYPEDCTFRF